jgi:integrase
MPQVDANSGGVVQIKFTEQTLSALSVPAGVRDHQWFDQALPGFGFRKFASGQAAYFVKYRVGRQQRKVTISKYTPGVLAQIRRKAAEILAEARLGNDRRALNPEQTATAELRMGDVVQLYLDARQPELDVAWHKQVKRFLEQYWASFHSRSLRSLDRGELIRELDEITRSRGATTADHARKALSALFAWAIDRSYCDANPLTRVKRRNRAPSRERALSMRELVAVWCGLRDEHDYGCVVRLLILTLQRKSEISDLQEPEIDAVKEMQIVLPGARTKNGRQHTVPLCKAALELLTAHPRRSDRFFLFGDGQRGFQGWSKAKGRLDVAARRLLAPELMAALEAGAGDLTDRAARKQADRAAKALGHKSADALLHSIMPPWTLHDLRRTGGTMMNEFSLAEPHVIEAILNHISGTSKGGVAGIYNRATYDIQKRSALERWADFLLSAVGSFDRCGLAGVDRFVVSARQQIHR